MSKSLCLFVLCCAFSVTAFATLINPFSQKLSLTTLKYKDPAIIAFYAEESSIKKPYRIIGKCSVSRHNFIGMTRPAKAIHDILRNTAASMGGDAIVNIKQDNHKVEGTIVSFEKVIL